MSNVQLPDREKQRVLFLTNIPAPYRIDFFNALGQLCDLTVVFEARRAEGIRFNWNEDTAKHFKAIFLNDGDINETHVDWRILRYIKPRRYDQIVATSYGYYTETAALFFMRLRGIPYDLEVDGGIVREGEHPIKRLMKRCIIRGAKRLFSSGCATDALFLHYGAKQSRIVRYPFTSLHEQDVLQAVPTEAERLAAKRRLHVKRERLVISIGQFIHRKGYDVLLNACDSLDAKAELAIIGGLPTDEYLEIVANKKLGNVRFLPFMEKHALDEWFLAADVFILPTREDMWGLVVNEAMAHALPVVTTLGCNAGLELVENGATGYLVRTEDGAALIERVNMILKGDELRAELSRQALQKMRAYTIEHMAWVHARAFGFCVSN